MEQPIVYPIDEVVVKRRATPSFSSEPIPEDLLQHLLNLTAFAPSGYNLQPWRFIVVQDAENRKKLRKAAMNQAKVEEAPVVVIACASTNTWKHDLEDMIEMAKSMQAIPSDEAAHQMKENAIKYLSSIDLNIWATKQTMIAYTHLMLLAEAYGLDTAPMEGFDPDKVKEAFGIPEETLVVALLAIGHLKDPDHDKPFAGRFSISTTTFREHFGNPWKI